MKATTSALATLSLLAVSAVQAQQSTPGAPSAGTDRSGAATQSGERQQSPTARDQAPRSSTRPSESGTRGNIGVAGSTETSRQQSGGADQQLAAWLVIDNHAEIALAKLAQQQAEHPQVQEFAQHMLRDHSQFIQKLQQFTGSSTSSSSSPTSSFEAERQALDQRASTSPRAAGATDQASQQQASGAGSRSQQTSRAGAQSAGGQISWISLKQQLGERHLESVRSAFENKPAQEFDKAYMTQQVMAHMHMLDTLQVFQQHASPELQQVLQEGATTTQQHLAQAKQLVEQLEKQQQAGGQIERSDSRQPGRTPSGQRPGANRSGQPSDTPSSRPQPPSAPSAQPQP